MKKCFSNSPRRVHKAFSLVEVMLAMFILGIGLIMVATIFPIGADWTRQSAEDNISQTIAQCALGAIQNHYGKGGDHYTDILGFTSTSLSPLPNFTQIPLAERSYQYGNSNPFPANNTNGCTYFWTALCRLDPDVNAQSAAAKKINIYILIYHKGDSGQTFTVFPSGYSEVTGTRQSTETTVPCVVSGAYGPGTYSANSTPAITGAFPPMGQIGIGMTSGTVFRQGVAAIGGTASPRPFLEGTTAASPSTASEQIIYAPPADSTNSGSPLVYVYQTTLTF